MAYSLQRFIYIWSKWDFKILYIWAHLAGPFIVAVLSDVMNYILYAVMFLLLLFFFFSIHHSVWAWTCSSVCWLWFCPWRWEGSFFNVNKEMLFITSQWLLMYTAFPCIIGHWDPNSVHHQISYLMVPGTVFLGMNVTRDKLASPPCCSSGWECL